MGLTSSITMTSLVRGKLRWLRGTVGRTSVFDRRTFRPTLDVQADGLPLMWVNRPL